MLVCVIRVELYLPGIHSLKEKRRVIKSLIERIKKKFNAAIAEVGQQDIWQTCHLGIALVGNRKGLLEREMEKILNLIEVGGEAEITYVNHETWGY